MKTDLEILTEKFDGLLKGELGKQHLLNPYFRISKGTPEQTKKYRVLNSKIPSSIILIWQLVIIPIHIFRISLTLILSIISYRQNLIFKQKIENSQVLFISHGTRRNLRDSEEDTFFSLIPQEFQKQKKISCNILYTNQSLFRFRKENKLLNYKNKEIKHILLPKFIPFLEHVNYIFTINSRAFGSLLLGFKYFFAKPDLSRILICSFNWYFSRSTYSNYLLLNRINYAQSTNKLIGLFLTFEGHSYEQLLVDWAKSKNIYLNIVLYQHSPIVPSHYGIRSFLTQLEHRTTVLTTGTFYKGYFQSISNLPIYKVIGSNKSNYLHNFRKNETTNNIIYAPESTNFATIEFIALIKNLITDLPNYSHYLRLHPDFKMSPSVKLGILRLKKHKNFFVSKNKLEQDLETAEYLVYRASALGIESLNFNILPIFYANDRFIGLNVLFSSNEVFFKAQNPSDVISLIGKSRNVLSLDKRIDLFNSYFSSLNLQILNDVI